MIGNSYGRSVGAMHGAERIIDEQITQIRQLVCERRLIGRFPAVETNVFEQQYVRILCLGRNPQRNLNPSGHFYLLLQNSGLEAQHIISRRKRQFVLHPPGRLLAAFEPRGQDPCVWAELREAQTLALALPRTGMAVAIDIGERHNIHPKNKQEVGRRLALNALGIVYKRKLVYSGPLYRSMAVEGSRIRVRFDHVGGGLATAGGQPLEGFQVAGPDGKYHPAQARIDGGAVLVWSDQVPGPVAVRYAWRHWPECNLCNQEGLPASPFRSGEN